jgi:gliding motility-associated-like protein
MKKFLLLFYFIFGYTIYASSAAVNYNPPPTVVNATFSGPGGTVNSSPVTVTLTLDKPVLSPLKITDFTVDNGSIATLSEKVTLTYSSQFGTAGSGNSMLNKPSDVALNAAGQTFVADGLNNRIEIFNADGSYSGQFGTAGTGNVQFNQPYGVAFDASGNVYVADMGNNRVQVYDNTFNYVKTIGTSGAGQLSSPKGIYVDASGNLYVADYGNNRVAIFDNTGTYKTQIKNAGTGAGQFLSPAGVALDAAGAIYITDSENGQVVKFSSTGNYIGKIVGSGSGALSAPTGITIDGTGKIYVVDNANQFVEVFSASGSALGIIAGSGSANGTFNFPEGITTDKNGNIYVADQINNRVQVLKVKEQYTLSVVPAANGTITINLPANIVQDVNGSGNIAASFSFYYIATPSTPSGLTAISLDKNVELDWAANPTNENIFSYKIYVRTATDAISLVATVPGSVTTYTAHTPLLVNGTTYYYSIVAVNNSGVVSDYSPEVAVVPKGDQTITAGTIPEKTYGDPPFDIAGIATASSGLAVTYSAANSLISIPTGGTVVTIKGAGTAHINVDQAGNAAINHAPTYDLQFTIKKATPIITWATPADIIYGTAIGATQLNAQANVPGTYVYDPTLLSATKFNVGPHTLTVTFTPTDNSNYNTVTQSVTINVKKADPVINWTVSPPVIAKTDVTTLENATISSPASIAGNWTYSNTPVGNTLHIGTNQTITATFTPIAPDADNYNIVSKTVTFNVVPITPVITWATPTAINYGTALSNTQLNATVVGGIAGTPTYDPAVGTVLPAGPDQPLTFHFVPIDADYAIVSQTVYIDVNTATPQIVWAVPAPITYGTALSNTQLNATTIGNVAGTMTYNPDFGTILTAGTQRLTATFVATDPNYSFTQVSAQVDLVVNQATPVITWATPADITYGTAIDATQLNAQANVPGTYVYTPTLLSATKYNVGPHTLTVTFTPTDQVNYKVATASVNINVKKADPVINWTVGNIQAKTLVSTLETATISSPATIAGNWTYSITPSTTVLHVGTGQTLTATFTPIAPDADNYNAVSKTVTFNVVPITPVITWATPTAINYGTALSTTQLNATVVGGLAGTPTYDPPVGTILSAGPGQPLTFHFVPTDADYATVSKTVYINVNAAIPQITWAPPAPITYGTALSSTQLNATTVGNIAGTMVYTPALGSILSAGTRTLTVVFTASDPNYNSSPVSATVSITIGQITPVITWPNPADISYGTLLSNVQLDATATKPGTNISIPGTFVYSPVAGGTALSVGSHTLSVTFHPSDVIDYQDGIGQTATIIVDKADPIIKWTPTAIPVNTVLGTAQLNATTVGNIAGTFDYGSLVGSSYSTPGNKSVTVTFHPADLTKYNDGATLTTTLNVYTVSTTNIDPQINWATPADITYGTAINSVQYNATATLPNTTTAIPGSYTYTSSSPDATPHVGTYTLTVVFTPTDATRYNTATKAVQIRVKPAATPLTWNTPPPVPVGTVLSAVQLDAFSTLAGTYAYTPAAGTVLNIAGNQNLSVTFTPTNTDYAPATTGVTIVIYTVDVTKTTPTLIWNTPVAINYGTALSSTQLNAKTTDATIQGVFTYSNPTGTILPVGPNVVSVTFIPNDNTHYNPAQANVTITVNAVQPQITWNTPAAIVYGTALSATQLNAQANIAGIITYSPIAGTILNAGAYTLLASFTPTDQNYAFTGKTVAITVNKATPIVTWPNPNGIAQGVALSDVQLNATANVPGTFSYSPAIGTVLDAGINQPLTVTFTPTDGANYNTRTQKVFINVGKLTPLLTWAAPAAITYGTALSDAQLYATSNMPGTFTYSPAAGTVLHAGNNQRLTVTFTPIDAVNYNSRTIYATINVNKATLIVAANNATRAYNQPDPNFSVSYSGLVNGDTPDNFITPVIIGTTTSITSLVGTYPITVSGATSNDYAFRFVSGTFSITAIGRDLTFDKLPVKTYGDADFDASASSTSGESIIYTSSNPLVATVVDGLIHIVGAGYVTITASLPVNSDYNTSPVVSQFMIVNKASQNIDFANIPVQLRGTTYDLSNVKSNSGLPVTFTSNDPMIASISGLTISSLRIGVTGIVANQAGDANYYAANTVVRQIEVVDPTREVIVHPAVSPNGDGINEYLYIEGINEHPDNRVTIINRNGVRVYEITGYDNAIKSFDGRSNFTGARQQAGTYFYLVEYVVNGVGRHLTGYFVLKYN